jgi:predicted  nucleic acid-binding Zn ribbon protein
MGIFQAIGGDRMFTAEIRFRVLNPTDDEGVADGVNGLIVSWQRNGQVLSDEWPIAVDRRVIRVFVSIPERTSLQRKLENKWAAEARRKLAEAGLSQPAVSILGREPSLDPCSCKKPSAFVLYTDYLSMESPLRCADCFNPVPLYRLPHTSGCDTYEDIIFWCRNYQRCDALQMTCMVGERFGTKQMSSLDSELSRQGLECRKRIAEVTKKPCYYYLYRYCGRGKAAEERRKCPSCGWNWHLTQAWHKKFDFRCDRCRLLSNFAYSVY